MSPLTLSTINFMWGRTKMKDRIKQIRNHFGLTQEKFAKRINKTTGFISSVETGRSGLSSDTIQEICSAFGINEAWLRDGTGEMGANKAPADINGIGERVKTIRKRENLTQEQFGNRISCSKNYVYYVETGKNSPSDEFLNKISSAFSVSYEWLRTGEGQIDAVADPVDDKLIEWLRRNPEIARELRIRGGLD